MSSHFIGRRQELGALSETLRASRAGRGRIVTVVGEPGMGKTRLMAETARMAEADGACVLWSQMIEDPATPPYFPWVLALRACLAQYDDEGLTEDLGSGAADLSDIVPELRDRLELPDSRPSTDSTAARFQLYDAVTRFLLAAARRRPLVLLLDNLHLVDRSSLGLLEYYCQQITASPTLVVGAYRDSELHRRHPLRSTLANLSRSTGFRRLALAGLSRDEVAQLLHVHLNASPPPAIVDALHGQSDGNPLFVTEVGGMLARQAQSGLMPGAGRHFEIPDSLRDVIAARLDTLPEGAVRLLGIAAVLGRDFEAGALCQLADTGAERVLELLGHAESSGIIAALGPGGFRFHHALFREVLYAEHSTIRRVTLHRKAAEYLESRHADDLQPCLPQLAYHYFEAAQSGQEHKAVDYCRQAAEAASARRAYGEAATQYERALQATELEIEPNLERRLDLLLAQGQAQFRSGHPSTGAQTLLKGALLAYRQQWWQPLAEAVMAFQYVQGQLGVSHIASVGLHEAALEHSAEEPSTLRARLYSSLAMAYRLIGRLEKAELAVRRGIELGRRCDDPEVLMFCLRMANWALDTPEQTAERLALAEEQLLLARRHGPVDAVMEAMIPMTFELSELGRIAELERISTEFAELAEAERHPHYRNVAAGVRTAIAILRGRWVEAVQRATEVVRQAPLQGVLGLEGRYSFQIFAIQKARGALAEIAPLVEQITGTTDAARLWLPGQTLLHCELGQRDRARAALERLGDLHELPKDDLYATTLIYLAEACASLRDAPRCRTLYELLLPFRPLNANLPAAVMHGAAAGYLAPLAVVLRRSSDARALFEEALQMNQDMGALPSLTRTQVDYAAYLLQGERPEDRNQARQLLAEARPAARTLELAPLLARIEQLQDSSGAEDLTSREIDVLRLIVAGASNQQIADNLFISHSTVATHVRNILRKIGAANRTEAAAYARRADLLPPA